MKPLRIVVAPPSAVRAPKPGARPQLYTLDHIITLVHRLVAERPGQLAGVKVMLDRLVQTPRTSPLTRASSIWWFPRLTGRPVRLARPRPLKMRRKES
jgi:hypothetical protein